MESMTERIEGWINIQDNMIHAAYNLLLLEKSHVPTTYSFVEDWIPKTKCEIVNYIIQ